MVGRTTSVATGMLRRLTRAAATNPIAGRVVRQSERRATATKVRATSTRKARVQPVSKAGDFHSATRDSVSLLPRRSSGNVSISGP